MKAQTKLISVLAVMIIAAWFSETMSAVQETPPPPSPPANDPSKAKSTIPPKLIKQVTPAYTEEARVARVQGDVILEIVIHKDGTVSVNRLVQGLGYGLDNSAKAAVEQWTFTAGTSDGVPVDVVLRTTVGFHLAGR